MNASSTGSLTTPSRPLSSAFAARIAVQPSCLPAAPRRPERARAALQLTLLTEVWLISAAIAFRHDTAPQAFLLGGIREMAKGLRIETTDLAAYKHWHTEVLGVLPQVRSITTFVVMGSPKDDRA